MQDDTGKPARLSYDFIMSHFEFSRGVAVDFAPTSWKQLGGTPTGEADGR